MSVKSFKEIVVVMDIEMVKFEKYVVWEIVFEVKLTSEEFETCDIGPLEHLGHYEIKKKDDEILIICRIHEKGLKENETIDDRLSLIKEDINIMVTTCKD